MTISTDLTVVIFVKVKLSSLDGVYSFCMTAGEVPCMCLEHLSNVAARVVESGLVQDPFRNRYVRELLLSQRDAHAISCSYVVVTL